MKMSIYDYVLKYIDYFIIIICNKNTNMVFFLYMNQKKRAVKSQYCSGFSWL
jgi:hypothetical protein